jgi:hypothetical protein
MPYFGYSLQLYGDYNYYDLDDDYDLIDYDYFGL